MSLHQGTFILHSFQLIVSLKISFQRVYYTAHTNFDFTPIQNYKSQYFLLFI